MDWMTVVTAAAVAAAAFMGWKLYWVKRDVYDFADRLEKKLDHILVYGEADCDRGYVSAGKPDCGGGYSEEQPDYDRGYISAGKQDRDGGYSEEQPDFELDLGAGVSCAEDCMEEYEDTLWGKVCEKLQRVDHVWQRKEEAAREEKKMMRELISDISHQTKTPIANLKIYLEILQDEEMSGMGKIFLEKLEGQTEKLDFLLQSMVKMSRLETGIIQIQSERSDLMDTLRRAVAAVVRKAEQKQIRLYVEPPFWGDSADIGEKEEAHGAVRIRHDQKWTEEAVFNILDNAVKYTEPGGTVRIAVTVQEIFARISIRDSGRGIAQERQAEIFTRFYREPEVHGQEGIGIGLYLARKITELQGGYIEVCSEPGAGADFRIYLPKD